MNVWHDLDPQRITVDEFDAFLEISKGSKVKYELDKDTGMLTLDRILHASMVYPAAYGFIPRTIGDDGDPLDVVVLCSETLVPNCLVRARPIGMITMIDGGLMDEKIIAVATADPFYNKFNDCSDLPAHYFSEMMHFFMHYKDLENKEVKVKALSSKMEMRQVIKNSIENYNKQFEK
ncbi:MAG: inorganic diphosphatase [Firmicutes bacterium]|nr:inorganic diphosphatase [Bacillota bacterium]